MNDRERTIVRKVCKELLSQRQKQGISQQRLSEDAGLSRTGLRHIESLQTNPTLYSLLKLAKTLDCDLAELIAKHDT